MPTYVYKCIDCEKFYETRVPIQDRDTVTVCPACGKASLKRLATAANFKFKKEKVGVLDE